MFKELKQLSQLKGLHVAAAKGRLIMADKGVNVVGVRLELKMKKTAFCKKSYDEIKTFWTELEKVKGVKYATICFNDGTGIFFVNCLTCCPDYGKIDRDGCIEGFPVGYVMDMGSYFTLTDDQDNPLIPEADKKGINGIMEPLIEFSYVHDNCEPLETAGFPGKVVSNV